MSSKRVKDGGAKRKLKHARSLSRAGVAPNRRSPSALLRRRDLIRSSRRLPERIRRGRQASSPGTRVTWWRVPGGSISKDRAEICSQIFTFINSTKGAEITVKLMRVLRGARFV